MQTSNGVKIQKSNGFEAVLALGNFDGLHLGHRKLIQRAKEIAAQLNVITGVFTFDPHPAQVLYPERLHQRLFGREDLVSELTQLGVEFVHIEPFSLEFAKATPESFIKNHLLPLKPKAIIVGPDFAFGQGRTGDIQTLKKWANENGLVVEVVEPVLQDFDSTNFGEKISSRSIRVALKDGNLKETMRLLGRNFYLQGLVIKGEGRGRQLGIPTANMLIQKFQVTPKNGVYKTRTYLRTSPEHPWSGPWQAVTNVGFVPTFKTDQPPALSVETHILEDQLQINKIEDAGHTPFGDQKLDQSLGQKMNLYGFELRVEFVSYLREEKKFASREELVSQIQRDIQNCKDTP